MNSTSGTSPEGSLPFRIRFRGDLNAYWFSTLQDVELSSTQVGDVIETTLNGDAPDEGAIIGIVNMLYELGCSLISVETFEEHDRPVE